MSQITIRCQGVRRVFRADAASFYPGEAARFFAELLARREYGRRAAVGALREDSHREDGSAATWEAFIGYGPTAKERRAGANGITGRNIWLHLSRA